MHWEGHRSEVRHIDLRLCEDDEAPVARKDHVCRELAEEEFADEAREGRLAKYSRLEQWAGVNTTR